jgi:predicted small metal-binding protein
VEPVVGRKAELVDHGPLPDGHRLGGGPPVTLGQEGAHEALVGGLGERRPPHELSGHQHALVGIAPEDPHVGQHPEGPLEDPPEPVPLDIEPHPVLAGQDRSLGDGMGDHGLGPRVGAPAGSEVALGGVDGPVGRLEIDAHAGGATELGHPAVGHEQGTTVETQGRERGPEAAERGVEHRIGGTGRFAAPQVVDEPLAVDRMPLHRESHEEQPAEPAGELALADLSVPAPHGDPPGDPELHHDGGNVAVGGLGAARCRQDRPAMLTPSSGGPIVPDAALIVECPCGVVIHERSLAELVPAVQRHAEDVHGMQLDEEQVADMARPA